MKYLVFILAYFGSAFFLNAQPLLNSDSALMANFYSHEMLSTTKSMSELKIKQNFLLKVPLYIYKEIFSSQISANCEYEPSCSSFSWLSLDEFNVFKALLLTADRLTRCNGNSQPETSPYLINHIDDKILDYPAQYRFNK